MGLDYELPVYTVKPVLCDLPRGTLQYGHIRQVVTKYRFN